MAFIGFIWIQDRRHRLALAQSASRVGLTLKGDASRNPGRSRTPDVNQPGSHYNDCPCVNMEG